MTTHIPAVLMVFKLIPEDNHSIKMGYYNINKRLFMRYGLLCQKGSEEGFH